MDLETLLKYSGMEKDVSESRMSDLDIEAQDNSRKDFIDMHSKTFGSAKEAGKFWDDSKESRESNESVETEAVGTAADPIMDLCDEVGCDPDHPIFQEIVRFLDADQIKEFVDDYRRHHEMNASFESDEVEAEEVVDEASEEVTNTGREEELSNIDRDSVTLDMVAPALKKLLMSYKADQKEYYDGEAEAKAELKAKGMSDEEVEKELMQGDPYDYSYIMIDDIEDSIEALENLMKNANDDGDDIVAMASSGDTAMREKFMQDIKYAIKQDHPEVYSKLFMYGIGESVEEAETVEEADVQETVEVAVDDLASLMSLAGLQADTQATKALDEYSNSPDEDYMDADMQLNKLSGGLNGPKAHTRKEGPGDNPLAAKLADQLQALMSK